MPPKVKITREELVSAAIGLLRRAEAVNARSVAAALGCSTQPVFSNFATMDELMSEVEREVYAIYLGFLEKEAKSGNHPRYKAFGVAYIKFAREERELFKLLFMCDRVGKPLTTTTDFEESVDMIMRANGISKKDAELFHLEMWAFVHGIAAMIVTSYLDMDDNLISRMCSDVYNGLCVRFKGGNGK